VRRVPNLPVSAISFTKVHGEAVKASSDLHCQDLKHAMSLGRRAFYLNINGSLLDFSMHLLARHQHVERRVLPTVSPSVADPGCEFAVCDLKLKHELGPPPAPVVYPGLCTNDIGLPVSQSRHYRADRSMHATPEVRLTQLFC